MVDAELSDVKETVEFLKDQVGQASNDLYEMKEEIAELNDDVYREMDRDYYDLKDYVKHRVHRHNKQKHACTDTTAAAADTTDPIQMIVTEYADTDADDTDADDTDAVADAEAAAVWAKPTLISNELASFLGKPEGSVLLRTEVTREVLAYIRDHKLQDKDNGRKINPDDKLFKLLKLNKGDELTYFSLQSYMAVHFTKFSADTTTADTTASAAAAEDEGVVIIMDNLFSAEDDE
jgi:chromatin remodeling complex protein RSC6